MGKADPKFVSELHARTNERRASDQQLDRLSQTPQHVSSHALPARFRSAEPFYPIDLAQNFSARDFIVLWFSAYLHARGSPVFADTKTCVSHLAI